MKLNFIPRIEMSEFEWDFDEKKWNRPSLDPALLKELSQRNNVSGFGRLALFLGLLALTAVATVYAWRSSAWYAIPFLYAYYFVYGFWGALAHELQHKTLFSKSLDWLSEILFLIAQTAIWLSPTCSRITHRIHHRYTMVKSLDHETKIHEHVTTPWTKSYLFSFILRIFVIGAFYSMFQDIRTLVGRVIGKRDEILTDHCKEAEIRQIRVESLWILLFHASVVAAAVYFQNWFLILFITLGWGIGGGFENLWHQTQHAGRSYDVNDQRLATRSVEVPRLVRLLYFGLDDHIEHHLFPAVPSANLPKLHEALKDFIPPRRKMVDCWRELFAIAHERDVRPDSEYLTIKDPELKGQ